MATIHVEKAIGEPFLLLTHFVYPTTVPLEGLVIEATRDRPPQSDTETARDRFEGRVESRHLRSRSDTLVRGRRGEMPRARAAR